VLVGAVGQVRERLPERPLGAVDDVRGHAVEGLRPVLRDDFLESLRADGVARPKRLEVAHRLLRNADVGPDEVVDGLVALIRLVELRRGNQQPLLEHLLGVGRPAAAVAANVVGVAERARDSHEVAPVEDWREHDDVREVTSADPRVVGDDGVARFEGVGREVLVEDDAGRPRERPREDGDALGGEPDGVPLRGHHCRRGVRSLADGHREREPLGGVVHLVGGRLEPVPQHLGFEVVGHGQGRGVERGHGNRPPRRIARGSGTWNERVPRYRGTNG
jgi:hypothetical protein